MKNYILSVVAAAIVCAVVRSVVNVKSAAGEMVKLLTGLMMTVTVVAPLANITFDNVEDFLTGISADAGSYVAEGEFAAQSSIQGIIKEQVEAYILDKANSMGLEIGVEVELDADNNSIPCGVTVKGTLSPYAKERLSAFLLRDLGIVKEKQKWT